MQRHTTPVGARPTAPAVKEGILAGFVQFDETEWGPIVGSFSSNGAGEKETTQRPSSCSVAVCLSDGHSVVSFRLRLGVLAGFGQRG